VYLKSFNKVVDIKQVTTQIFDEINFMRNNPKEYAKTVENHMQFLRTRDNQFYYDNLDYKVPLPKGADAFINCIDILKSLVTLKRFNYSDEIKVICPDKADDQLKPEELTNEIKEKYPQKKIEFNSEFVFPKPEAIVVLLLVHKGMNPSTKRSNLLNENFVNLGISLKKAKGKEFCLYLTFSD
jgi:hypothetical protein